MTLTHFLRKKGKYRWFKQNWIKGYKAHHPERKLSRHSLNILFFDWMTIWELHPAAIYRAFPWDINSASEHSHWAIVDEEWRAHCRDFEDYGELLTG